MTIRLFDENRDIDDFLELYRISFGKRISKEYVEWKYIRNPFRMNVNPIIVVEENNRVVGVRCDVFGRMMIKGTIIYTTLGADSMVHPEFRGRGTQVELVGVARELYRDSQYRLHYTFPNNMSFNNLIRAGRQPICKIAWHWKILDAREVFNKVFHNPIPRKTGVLLSPFLCYKTRVPKVRNQGVTVKEVSDMAILEHVYNRWKNTDKIYTVRDAKYLNWRFKSHPEKEYQFLAAYVEQEVKGYFVINEGEFRGLRRGTIVDYLVVEDAPDVFEMLLNYALNLFQASNCALVDTWVFTQKWVQSVVEGYGFISSRNILLRRWFSYCYLLADPWGEQDFAGTLASTAWYVTPSDADAN